GPGRQADRRRREGQGGRLAAHRGVPGGLVTLRGETMNRAIPRLRVGLLLLAALLAGCSGRSPEETVWVGHLAPLSGSPRDRGEQAVQAIELALEQAKEDGVTAGGRPLGVRHVDAAGGEARAEAVRLLTVNRVAALIVGPGVSGAEEVVAEARAR